MSKNEFATKAVHRISAIQWQFDERRVNSHIVLMREYLRRAALWANALSATSQWPFFDIPGIIDSTVRADSETLSHMDESLRKMGCRLTIRNTCVWYVHWEALMADQPLRVADFGLDAPFEPLIRLFERNGRFNLEDGYINIFTTGIPAVFQGPSAYSSLAPLDIQDVSLDSFDQNP